MTAQIVDFDRARNTNVGAIKTRRLVDETRKSAYRLHWVLNHLERGIDELDLPADGDALDRIAVALLRLEQEAQRQLPWLCRDGGRA